MSLKKVFGSLIFSMLLQGCSSSMIHETESLPIEKTAEKQQSLDFKLDYYYYPDGDRSHSQLLANGSKLHSGDQYEIRLTPIEDSYIYIYQVDANLMLFDLVTLSKVDRKVKANQEYAIPFEGKTFELDDLIGTETVYFLAFKQANTVLENKFEEILQANEQGDKTKAENLQKYLIEEFDRKTRVEMAENYLKGMCQNCVNIVSFEHLNKQ